MFTGIIEELGKIEKISVNEGNRSFYIKSTLTHQLKVDESVSHNGICLTIEEITGDIYRVTAVKETLSKTNSLLWKPDDFINLERAMKMNGRLDGHMVQGHVDDTAQCIEVKDEKGSKEFTFRYRESFAPLIIEKGSTCINGVSLTVFNLKENTFKVTIIPYTMEHTNFKTLKKNDIVNIEFDILGKYVQRILDLKK
ncbi:MAG: riboflavin synthase [Ginsengibacter sp.]